jgi:hypothetical protein
MSDIDLTSLYTTIGGVLGTPADLACNHIVTTVNTKLLWIT